MAHDRVGVDEALSNASPTEHRGNRRAGCFQHRLRGYGMSTLVERASGEVVGFCGLVHPGGQPEAEIKYALKRRYWGLGLATEAVRAMLDYGASARGLRRIIATTGPENVASQKMLVKAGMTRENLRRNDDGSFTQMFAWQPADNAL